MDTILVIAGVLLIAGLGALVWYTRSRPADQSTLLLANRLEAMAQQMNQQLEHSRQASEQSSRTVFQQVQGFTQGLSELKSAVQNVQQQVSGVVTFQDIFRSPKLRGIWGEASLESALAQYFPRERYKIQHYFKSGEAVDAVLTLPNDLLLPIDSKFNWENFEKMVHADTEVARDGFRKQFLSDVKKKIDEIATKYLLPGEGTTDFALMYMPAETLYYEVIQNMKEVDLGEYARAKKVILVSPNTFFLTVSAVTHWFKDVQFSRQTQDIMKRLARVVQDAGKLAEEFRVLGKHIGNAQTAFEDTDKRLGLLVDRTQRVIEMGEDQKALSE